MSVRKLFCITNFFTNSYLIENDSSIILIDAGWPQFKESLIKGILKAGYEIWDITHIVFTHHHVDHAGLSLFLKERSGALTAAHSLDSLYISGQAKLTDTSSLGTFGKLHSAFFSIPEQAYFPPCEVDIHLREGESYDFLEGLEIVHTPGHTEGSISVLNRDESWIIAGDSISHLFNVLWHPTLSYSVSLTNIHDSFKKISELKTETVMFGHGPPIKGKAYGKIKKFYEKAIHLRQ